MTNTELNQSNDLCLSCGFCCDGTFFSHVTLQENEENKKRSNIELELVDGSYSFVQPCQALSVTSGCQVYADRPTMCIKFECDLLKKVNENKISDSDALIIVQKVKSLKETLKRNLLKVGCPEQYLISYREQVVYIESELSQEGGMEKYREVHLHFSNVKSYIKSHLNSDE